MKIIKMLYRSNDKSSVITSATDTRIREFNKYIDTEDKIYIETINLDKRNIDKYLDKLEDTNLCKFYIFEDEEVVMDKIKERNIKFEIYNLEKSSYQGRYATEYNYTYISDKIIEEAKEEIGYVDLWEVTDDKVKSIKIFKVDYNKLDKYRVYKDYKYFENKNEAITKLKENITNSIKNHRNSIANSNKRIVELNKLMSELEVEYEEII